MNTSKFITAVVGNEKITYAEPITRVDYGLRLRIKGIALPDSYEVDFSQNEEGGESVTVIGDAQGAEIPAFLIKTGKDIYAFLFWVGEGYGRRVKKIMIPNEAGPDRTDIAPEPAEQSVIDQTIAKLNGAVSHAPRIGTDGCWELWDPEQGEYVSTGKNTKGDTGNSGVYIGDDEPTDEDINVWIDTDGDADEGDTPADGTEVPEADISELATRLNVHFVNGANDKTYTQIVDAINAGKTVTGYSNGSPSVSVQMVHNDYRNMDEVKFVFIEGVYETPYMRITGVKARTITVGPNYAETSSYHTISFDA